MKLYRQEDAAALGRAAGLAAAQTIRNTIEKKGEAAIILATGASQFATLATLVEAKNIDWSVVTMFHLDEYIGLPASHPASFRRYLQERFISKVAPMKAVFLINGETDAVRECTRLDQIISQYHIDLALVGIGENGHLAFNDPPADFDTTDPYLIVALDEACRLQQMGEGWFASIEEVPAHAISMSVRQILLSAQIICSVPDSRKAMAVKNTLEQPVGNVYPASILQTHANCDLYLDTASAALLKKL